MLRALQNVQQPTYTGIKQMEYRRHQNNITREIFGQFKLDLELREWITAIEAKAIQSIIESLDLTVIFVYDKEDLDWVCDALGIERYTINKILSLRKNK